MKPDLNLIITCCFAFKSKKIDATQFEDSRGAFFMSKAKQLKNESINSMVRKAANKRAEGTGFNPLKGALNRHFC